MEISVMGDAIAYKVRVLEGTPPAEPVPKAGLFIDFTLLR